MLVRNDILYRSGKIDHHSIEYRIIGSWWQRRWVLDQGGNDWKNKDNKPLKIVGTHTNITERKKPEQLLKLNEEKYRSIIANMNLGLLEWTMKLYNTPTKVLQMSGFDLDELIGKKHHCYFYKGENSEMVETKNELRKKVFQMYMK